MTNRELRKNNGRSKSLSLAVYEEKYLQTLKITPIKQLAWNEVVFVEDDREKFLLSKKIAEHLKKLDILKSDATIRFDRICTKINSNGQHSQIAEKIFNALEEISKEKKYGFFINYNCQEDYTINNRCIPYGKLFFYGEVIFYGERLINNFENQDINPTYATSDNVLLIDCENAESIFNEVLEPTEKKYKSDYSEEKLLEKGMIHYYQAKEKVCASMIEYLENFFYNSYVLDVIYGKTMQDYEGVLEEVKAKLLKRF